MSDLKMPQLLESGDIVRALQQQVDVLSDADATKEQKQLSL